MKLDISKLRCVSQVALLGSITPNLRAVIIAFDNESIRLFFYYNNAPSEEEEELAEEVASEIISDCTEYMIETEKITVAYPQKIPEKKDGVYVYFRHEDSDTLTD
ncbi:MAG: hypothetical protein KDK55_06545 [Chlamydiia bacterium]|nr:hypothetical protein [Chlamydiia bacterium]